MENEPLDTMEQSLPNSVAVLVLGILSIVLCFCYGIPGIILGIIAIVLAKKANRMYLSSPENYADSSFQNMKAGRICAIIGLSLSILFVILIGIYIAFIFILGADEVVKIMEQYQ